MKHPFLFPMSVLAFALFSVLAVAAPVAGLEHVVVVGIDGMTASSVNRAQTPNMHEVMARGVFTLHGRTVDPSVSSPNWASIIMGAAPEKHGITSNDWKPGDTPAFPTIFGVCKAAYPDAAIGAIYEWGGFGNLFRPGDVTFFANPKCNLWQYIATKKRNADVTAARAAAYIQKERPLLTFVHLDLVDHAGHGEGYDSADYDLAVAKADGLAGQIMKAVKDAGMEGTTAIFIISDHGGTGTGHGGKSEQETTVPWMAAGPGVARGKELPGPMSVSQTAPTIALLLGLTPPEQWTEKAVEGVLE